MSSAKPNAEQNAHLVRRVLVEGEYVVNHSAVIESGEPVAVRFDLWRTSGDEIVEHWYDEEPWQTTTANGHTQIDGTSRVDTSADTEVTRQITTNAVQKILVEGDVSGLGDHLAGEEYVQHNPRFDNGVSGLVQALTTLAEQGITMRYDRIRQVVADGDFAYIRSEGTFAGDPYVFHDLFRVTAGKCVEHWDVMVPRT
jgi:predicted SnoaL-like aldol condensation-catalyzing enzyme